MQRAMTDEEPNLNDETFVLRANAGAVMDQVFHRFLMQYKPFGFQSQSAPVAYHPLPYRPKPGDELLLPQPWRIRLELHVENKRMVMGLDLYGDVILGRGDSRPGRIVVNLDSYGALNLGVSREHVMLRPTPTRLFAIDQGSTNRTMINGSPSGRGIATELRDESILALGDMVFMVNIVDRPATAKK